MSLTMHTATVATCTRALNSLAAILEKAAAHAEARKIDPAALLSTRLYPDMLPLAMQIQLANDSARGGAARLAGFIRNDSPARRVRISMLHLDMQENVCLWGIHLNCCRTMPTRCR